MDDMIEKKLEDGTVIRMTNPAPSLSPFARYVILSFLYEGNRKRRLDALTSAWRGTTCLTWINLGSAAA